MQHILEKLGYVYCGKVPIDGERLAYQKIKPRGRRLFIKKLMKLLTTEFINLRGIKIMVFSVKTYNNINQIGLKELGNHFKLMVI